LAPHASSWASRTQWHSIKNVPQLAFDHSVILTASLEELKSRILREDIWASVLPEKFSLTQFQQLFETILNKEFDKGNFRKKVSKFKFLSKLTEAQTNVSHRPSLLYTFDAEKYAEMIANGFSIDF
jgi:8-oxo-dGTP diphosphatase